MNYQKEHEQRLQYIESVIESYMPHKFRYQEKIIKAMEYNMSAEGKRIRSMLMLEVLRMFGGNDDYAKPFLAAIEMIHTYSLIHDDLPALDNDDLRRGRKTTHIVFGEAMAILTGDALLNYAFEVVSSAFMEDDNDIRIAKSIQVLSQKSGIYGMIGGQVADIEGANDIDKIDYIYSLKTGALIEASMMIGAILAGAHNEQVQSVEKAAKDIGFAFQIQDDILDITGTDDVLGKPVGSDNKNNKVTYVTLIGIEKAKEAVKQKSNNAVSILKEISDDNEFLIQFVLKLINREK